VRRASCRQGYKDTMSLPSCGEVSKSHTTSGNDSVAVDSLKRKRFPLFLHGLPYQFNQVVDLKGRSHGINGIL